MLQTTVLIIHLLVTVLITGLVLLQRGKGAEAGTGFGAGASGTVFGARGSSSFLSRATAALATLFFITSLTLAFVANQSQAPTGLAGSVLQTTQQTVPAASDADATTTPSSGAATDATGGVSKGDASSEGGTAASTPATPAAKPAPAGATGAGAAGSDAAPAAAPKQSAGDTSSPAKQ